jgi:hypothetical protein
MKRQMRTVERWGDTGRLRREDIRAVVIALRDGKPLPKVRPVERKPLARPAATRQR